MIKLENYKIVLSMFEVYPYEILILQDSHGELITLKIYKSEFRF
jgi:hypothetical protein